MTDEQKNNLIKDTGNENTWVFELYVIGMNPRAIYTLANIKEFCKKYISTDYEIKLIDLTNTPELAREKQIFAIPTLIKISPAPICRSIGDLSNFDSLKHQLSLNEQ